jgi:hypothetical protein
MEWLPPLICCANRNWLEIIGDIYPVFERDFVIQRPVFDDLEVRIKTGPLIDGRERSFWHLVTEGPDEYRRKPDLRRCERIAWARAVIDHADDTRLRRWKQERYGNVTIAIALPDFSYIVFLGRREPDGLEPYMLLLTAYCADTAKRQQKHRGEWQDFMRNRR